MDVRAKLKEMGYDLGSTPKAVAVYVPAVRSGNLVYVSGQLPMRDGELMHEGKVPENVSLEDAGACARQSAINALAAIDGQIGGDWSRFVRIVRVAVFVNCDSDFNLQHKVANAASELYGELFGEAGHHARAAVGASGLPLGAPVEIEVVAEVR